MEGIKDGRLGIVKTCALLCFQFPCSRCRCACGARQHLASLAVDTLPRRNHRIKIKTPVARFENLRPSPSNFLLRPFMGEEICLGFVRALIATFE